MTDFETTSAKMREAFPEVIERYSQIMGLSSQVLSAFTELDFVEGESNYGPYPTIRENNGRDLTIMCNLNGMEDGWDAVFSEAVGVDEELSRKIYIASGLAWVGMVHIAYDAVESRSERVRDGLKRVKMVTQQLEDSEIIKHHIKELELADKVEASLYPIDLSTDDIQLINRIRFGLGVAYLVNDVDFEVRERVGDVFLENFANDLKKMGDSLISFAYSFGLDKQVDVEHYKQKGVSRALHVFNFAGIFPMDMSDIMRT